MLLFTSDSRSLTRPVPTGIVISMIILLVQNIIDYFTFIQFTYDRTGNHEDYYKGNMYKGNMKMCSIHTKKINEHTNFA